MTAPRASASGLRRPASGIAIDAGRLTRMRKERSWDREDLARAAGLSVSMISKIENKERRPRATTLAAICAALNCTPGDLLLPDEHAFSTPDGNKTYCAQCGYTRAAGNHI